MLVCSSEKETKWSDLSMKTCPLHKCHKACDTSSASFHYVNQNHNSVIRKSWEISGWVIPWQIQSFKQRQLKSLLPESFRNISTVVTSKTYVLWLRWTPMPHLICIEVSWSWSNESHVRAVFYVLIITHDVHSIFARLFGPILHITWAIILVITLYFSLRRAFYCKTWKRNR